MSSDSEISVCLKIQDTLVSINDITLNIKKELNLIEELVRENGQLHTAISTANEVLSNKICEMGLNVTKITNESELRDRLESDPITSAAITEKLLSYMDA